MKLELKEHELERVIEVYLQLQFNKEVKVNGFDLSGMRSKDGLSAMVDFTLVGESDVRDPKEVSNNVKPTDTSWRQREEEKRVELEGQDLEDWTKFLDLIADNAQYRNYDAIMDLADNTSEVVRERIDENELFLDMLENVEKQVNAVVESSLNNDVPSDELEPSFVETFEEIEEEPSVKEEPDVQPGKNIFNSPLGIKPVNVHNTTPRKLFK